MLWSVRLDATLIANGTDEDVLLAARDTLSPYSPSVGIAHHDGQPVAGRVTIQFAVEAPTLARAQDDARRDAVAALKEHATHVQVVRMDAMMWDEFEADLDRAPAELLGAQETADELGMSRQRVHQLYKERADFPRPVAHLKNGPVWAASTIRRWKATATRKTGRPRRSETA